MSTLKKNPPLIATIVFVAAGFLTFGATLAQALYIYQDPNYSVEDRVNDLLGRMTLDEKIGQMTQGPSDISPVSNITDYNLGSILSGGHHQPPTGNTATDWANLYDNLQAAALATRLGIPIIYGIDAVHGHAKVRDAVVFPHNIGLGATIDKITSSFSSSLSTRS